MFALQWWYIFKVKPGDHDSKLMDSATSVSDSDLGLSAIVESILGIIRL